MCQDSTANAWQDSSPVGKDWMLATCSTKWEKLLSGFGMLHLAAYKWQFGMEALHFFPTQKPQVVSSLIPINHKYCDPQKLGMSSLRDAKDQWLKIVLFHQLWFCFKHLKSDWSQTTNLHRLPRNINANCWEVPVNYTQNHYFSLRLSVTFMQLLTALA